MSSLRLFQKTAAAPSGIADCLFKCAGRVVVCDQGYFSILTKLMLKVWLVAHRRPPPSGPSPDAPCHRLPFQVLDWNLLTDIIKFGISMSGDYQALKKERPHQPTAASGAL
jgi:hypothetical protein